MYETEIKLSNVLIRKNLSQLGFHEIHVRESVIPAKSRTIPTDGTRNFAELFH